MRARKRWLFKCQFPQDLWVLAVEKAQSDLLLSLLVWICGKWAGATSKQQVGVVLGAEIPLTSRWYGSVSVLSFTEVGQCGLYYIYKKAGRAVHFFCFFWSSLTMCGWKEDKVCSALFSASGRQLRRKAYLLMSGKAEVNLDWSWLKKVWGSAMSSSTERFHRWAHHCFNFIATFFWKVLLCLFCFLPLRNTFNQFPATALVLPWRH